MRIKGNSFLVVGGAGFIGSHVVDQLLQGGAARVRVLDNLVRGTRANLASALDDARCELMAAPVDIRDRASLATACSGMDGVFHLAALWLLECLEDPRAAFDVNVTGTMNVAEAAIAAGVQRLVFSSSASVYGDAQVEPMAESHPLGCQEMYGATKVAGEMLLRALGNRNGSLSWVGLRYMNVYGARQDDRGAYVGVVTRMLRDLRAHGEATVHGDGSQCYDFVDVRDCARANVLAMESSVTGGCYNVGTGVKTSIRDLAGMLTAVAGGVGRVHFDGAAERPFVRNRVGDPRRAEEELGFVASITLERGLEELVRGAALAGPTP